MEQRVKKTRVRGRLSPDLIVDAAFDVVEREGLSGFSTRKLAAELGCEAMSIYHHFPSMAHLFEAMVDGLVGSIRIPPPDRTWRERLRGAMEEYRRIGRKHPAFAPYLITYRMNSPVCLEKLDEIIGLFNEGGFDREQGARLFRTISYYLMGAILDETSGYAKGPSAVTTVNDDELRRSFPNVAAAGPFFAQSGFDETFNLGLEIMLDEIERLRLTAGKGHQP